MPNLILGEKKGQVTTPGKTVATWGVSRANLIFLFGVSCTPPFWGHLSECAFDWVVNPLDRKRKYGEWGIDRKKDPLAMPPKKEGTREMASPPMFLCSTGEPSRGRVPWPGPVAGSFGGQVPPQRGQRGVAAAADAELPPAPRSESTRRGRSARAEFARGSDAGLFFSFLRSDFAGLSRGADGSGGLFFFFFFGLWSRLPFAERIVFSNICSLGFKGDRFHDWTEMEAKQCPFVLHGGVLPGFSHWGLGTIFPW